MQLFLISDACASVTCQNGGTCNHQLSGTFCQCRAGFAGQHCGTGKTIIKLIIAWGVHCYYHYRHKLIIPSLANHKQSTSQNGYWASQLSSFQPSQSALILLPQLLSRRPVVRLFFYQIVSISKRHMEDYLC